VVCISPRTGGKLRCAVRGLPRDALARGEIRCYYNGRISLRRLLKHLGTLTALAALLALHSTHWAALQTVAWSKMLVSFAQQESVLSALARTFDGRNPCELCLKVREGIAQDQQHPDSNTPAPTSSTTGEALWQFRVALSPAPPLGVLEEHPFVPTLHTEFQHAPPRPPPRPLLNA